MSSNELAIPFVYAGEVLAAAIALPLVAMLAVGLRFWLRISKQARVGIDDWTILLALFPLVGMGICLIYGTAKKAIGYPSPPYPVQLNPPTLEELTETTPEQTIVFKMDWIIWVLMIPGNGLIKLSAVLLYRRIFIVHKDSPFDIYTKVMITICSLWTLGFWLAQIFGCGSNFKAPFGTLEDVGSCNTNTRLDALMISDLITDVLVWSMPIPLVWRLNMSTAKKFSVTGVLSLAAVSLAAAIVRLIVQEEISNGGYAAHTDVNLTLTILLYWSMLESGLALIAACLPTLQFWVIRTIAESAISSVRRLLSNRHQTSKSLPMHDGRSYLQILTPKTAQPSNRTNYESYALSDTPSKVSDVENGNAHIERLDGSVL